MEFYSIILLCFLLILFYAVEFTSTVSSGASAFRLIRYTFNETLPCAIPQAENFKSTDVTWLVTNNTVRSLQIWPFDFEDDILWREFDFGRDYSLIIKKGRLHHGGIYTCQIGSQTSSVEAVIFRPHCAFKNEGTNEKLDCDVEHSGPTTPNVTWLGGNAKPIPGGQTYRSPSSTRVVTTTHTSNGPFECRVSDHRLNRAKTACYRGGRITDRTTRRITTAIKPEATTIQTTTIKSTTKTTVTTESSTSAQASSSLSSPIITSTPSDVQTQATSVPVQNVTTESRFAETDHQVHNSTVTTVTPDADSLTWIIIASLLVFMVLLAVIIVLLIIRVRKKKKHQDYVVEKAKEPLSSEVPLGLFYDKEADIKNGAGDPMLVKKAHKGLYNPV